MMLEDAAATAACGPDLGSGFQPPPSQLAVELADNSSAAEQNDEDMTNRKMSPNIHALAIDAYTQKTNRLSAVPAKVKLDSPRANMLKSYRPPRTPPKSPRQKTSLSPASHLTESPVVVNSTKVLQLRMEQQGYDSQKTATLW